jgi:tripartite-type tricarboxylate transporter receptor subunit TctC
MPKYLVLPLLFAFAALHDAGAQTYPSAPVKLVVPLAAGGGVDMIARIVAPALGEGWSQKVTVENQPGGTPFGALGTDFVARAAADGHTLLVTGAGNFVLPSATRLPYDPVKSFVPVSLIAYSPYVLTTAINSNFNSVADIIAAAKAGALPTFGSSGDRTMSYWAGESFRVVAGFNAMHIPHRGAGPAVVAVGNNLNNFGFFEVGQVVTIVKAGKLRALAVAGDDRHPEMPAVPTMQEAGVGRAAVRNWVGVLAPAGTPPAVVQQIQAAVARAAKTPGMIERINRGAAFVAVFSTSTEELARFLQSEVTRWQEFEKQLGTLPL